MAPARPTQTDESRRHRGVHTLETRPKTAPPGHGSASGTRPTQSRDRRERSPPGFSPILAGPQATPHSCEPPATPTGVRCLDGSIASDPIRP